MGPPLAATVVQTFKVCAAGLTPSGPSGHLPQQGLGKGARETSILLALSLALASRARIFRCA